MKSIMFVDEKNMVYSVFRRRILNHVILFDVPHRAAMRV